MNSKRLNEVLRRCKGVAHGKTKKALRRQAKMELRRIV